MRHVIYKLTCLAGAIALCMALTACDGGGQEREGRNVTVTQEPTASVPTATPTPANVYMYERTATMRSANSVIWVTTHFTEDGDWTDSVTETSTMGDLENPSRYEVTERKTKSGEFTVTIVTERYEAGAIRTILRETTQEDGATQSVYEYYTYGMLTERDTDYTDGEGRCTMTRIERFGEDGKRTFMREVQYRDDAFAVPLTEITTDAEGKTTTRTCAEGRYIEATETRPALAVVSESSADGNRLLLVIGSFETELNESTENNVIDTAVPLTVYDLKEPYDGYSKLVLYYSEDGKNDLTRAEIGTAEKYDQIVWERHPVTQKRVETDSYGSYKIIDVHEDGTEIVRFERKYKEGYVLKSETTYDSKGKVTDSIVCEDSADGRVSTSRELVTKANGTEVTFVKQTERLENGQPGIVKTYTQEGDRIVGLKTMEYTYNERGEVAKCVCTSEDGNEESVTEYTYVYKERGK